MSETIGFIGLGDLGLPVATNLLKAGYGLRVYNRTASKADPLVAQGAYLAKTPADAVPKGGVVVTLIWDDAAVESVVTSDGFLDQLQGGIHISMSTILPETAQKLAALHAEHGSVYIDAPIFGRPQAAIAHELQIPIAGPQAAKDRVRPILEAMGGKGIVDFGEAIGAGVTVKLIGNYLFTAARGAMEEGLTLAMNRGVNPKAVIDMLTGTLLSAPIYKGYAALVTPDKLPSVNSPIPLKDVGLFQQIAQTVNAPTPIAHLLEQMMRDESN